MYFKDLKEGDKFKLQGSQKIFTKIKGQLIEDGELGGYVYNARDDSSGELQIIGQYLDVREND